MSAWTETSMGRVLARNTFKRGLCVVPNCTYPGHECDLLVVTERLMLVDVEIKISRADLKADAAKEKWLRRTPWREWMGRTAEPEPTRRAWPPRIWKHYYALPRAIWKPELADALGSSASGVILVGTKHNPEMLVAGVERRALPNPEAKPLEAAEVANVARLASLRMWDALCRQQAEVEA